MGRANPGQRHQGGLTLRPLQVVGWVERQRNPSAAAPDGLAHDVFRFAQPILQEP